jgi:group II intron reverse transcriptase/maturase
MQNDAGCSDGLQRLEVIRKLNAKSGWITSDLYRLLFKPELYVLAYERIKSKPGNMTPGTDEETIDGFGMDEIRKLIEEMRTEKYQPSPVRRALIPKSNGKMRKLGIPSARDKIVQEVVRLILEAIYDSPHGAYFKESSHGFRRSRSCHSALKEIQSKWSGTTWFLEGDIKACFDDINHEILVNIMRKKIKDERFLSLIWKFLNAGYQDLDESRKDSLAGTPQGGIVSPILANVYLHELDAYVEQLQHELEKGELRRPNPEYRSLQKRRQYLAKTGRANTEEYKDLGVQMRKFPSLDPKDPNFVRVRYVRYADDWVVGIIGPKRLAEEIKEKVRQFLKAELDLTLSEEKTVITNARTADAKFLGYRMRLGRSKTAEQKQTLSTNASGKNFKRRSTGMQIVLKAPMEELIKKLTQKGFCDASGRPLHKKAWTLLDEDQIVSLYSSINRGLQNYYRPTDNWVELSRIQYILKFSLAKTLAAKKQVPITRVIKDKGIYVNVTRKGQQRIIVFYRNTDWKMDRKAFTNSPTIDLVRMNERMRTRSKLGLPCCICYESNGVAMHHVRHIRKMTDKQAKGFNSLLAKLNRKQIPVCSECHRKIHNGTYDGLKVSDLAYDPRKPILIGGSS